MRTINTHRDLNVFKNALEAALVASKTAAVFPAHERPFQDQLRRAARSPGAAIAEAWRRRRYRAYWVNKLSEAQSEAGEAQYWIELAWREGYCSQQQFENIFQRFEQIIAQLSAMIAQPGKWNPELKS